MQDMAAQLEALAKKHKAGHPGAAQELEDFMAARKEFVKRMAEVCTVFCDRFQSTNIRMCIRVPLLPGDGTSRSSVNTGKLCTLAGKQSSMSEPALFHGTLCRYLALILRIKRRLVELGHDERDIRGLALSNQTDFTEAGWCLPVFLQTPLKLQDNRLEAYAGEM